MNICGDGCGDNLLSVSVCVWSLHCCLVKYVMNILKRNLGWRVVFGQYIVVLWSMWWTVWIEILFEGLCLVNTLLSCELCDEQFEKKSGLMNHMLLVHLIASPVNVAVKSWKRNVIYKFMFVKAMFLWCLDKDVLWEMWFKN